jgi:alpha-1,2-mannosyltransferase
MNGLNQKKWGFFTRAILFCLFNLVLVNGALFVFGKDKTVFEYSRDTLLAKPSFADSWDPMARGLKVFTSGEDPTIYQKVFFNQKHKFQYPPTSLLVIDVVKRVIGDKIELSRFLDWISWLSVIGTIVFTILIFLEGVRRYVPEESQKNNLVLSIVLVTLCCMTFYPLLRAYVLGQIQTWLNLLFAISLWFWLRKRKEISGACLGFISIIKPQMGLYLFWGLIRKYWKFCALIAGIAGFVLGVSVLRYGLPAHFKYLEVLSFIAERGETYYPNQSVNGLMNRMLFNGNNLDWDAWHFAPPNEIVRLLTMLTSAVLIGGVMLFKRKLPESDSWLGFVTAGLVFTLASPVAWEHHYGILLPIFALALPKAWELREKWRGGLIWLGAAYVLSTNIFLFTNATAATGWNFLQSYLFFGGLILLGVLVKMQILCGINEKLFPLSNH